MDNTRIGNTAMISTICQQIEKQCESVIYLTEAYRSAEDVAAADVFEDVLLDDISHIQMLTLEMTRLVNEGAEGTEPSGGAAEGAGRP